MAEDTIEKFEKTTGIKVVYDVYDSNEMLEAKLHKAIVEILSEPATKAKLLDLGFEMVLDSPEAFAKYQAAEYSRWQKLITERKITAD